MEKLFDFFKKNFALIAILLLQIPLIFPFFHRGFFPSHDDVQVTRVFEIFQSLKYGDIPPRWSANLLYGHGYPLFIFYSPFSYLVGALFSFFGFNFLLSTKIVFILSFILGGMGVYFLIKEWWGKLPAITAAIGFSYAPYRAVDVFVRGNLAEFFAFSFFPWIFLANWKLLTALKDKKIKWEILLSITLFISLTSHNLSSFIFLSFLLIFDLFYISLQDKKDILANFLGLTKSVLLSLLLSSYYLIPLFAERKYVMLDKFASFSYWEFFLTLSQIWHSSWGFGGFLSTDAMSLQLGKTIMIFSLLGIVGNFLTNTKFRKIIIFFFLSLLFCLFMEIKQSEFIWRNIKLLSYLQFPWRFHILATFLASILAGASVFFAQDKNKRLSIIISVIFLSITIFENFRYFRPKLYWSTPSVSETTTWQDEYLPKWVKEKPKDYATDKVKIISGNGKITNVIWGYLNKEIRVETQTHNTIQIAHVYYPGWKVYVNSKISEIRYDNPGGLMQVDVTTGKNKIIFVFSRTPLRFVSELVSIFGLVLLLVMIIN